MPKLKSNSGAKKRFKTLKSGKIKRKKANMRHILAKKSTKRKRHLRQATYIDSAEIKKVRRLLPYGSS